MNADQAEPHGEIRFPVHEQNPLHTVLRRVLVAVGSIVLIALVVYLGRDGYTDSAGGDV